MKTVLSRKICQLVIDGKKGVHVERWVQSVCVVCKGGGGVQKL